MPYALEAEQAKVAAFAGGALKVQLDAQAAEMRVSQVGGSGKVCDNTGAAAGCLTPARKISLSGLGLPATIAGPLTVAP